tara:strand:- start:8784 stop:8924 length:141 start_codon:yes stop_codon:yes gene_type:complete
VNAVVSHVATGYGLVDEKVTFVEALACRGSQKDKQTRGHADAGGPE